MNSINEKQSLDPGPGSHLSLHTCQEEIQPERPHLPEIKGPGLRTMRPGAVPRAPWQRAAWDVMYASLPGLCCSFWCPRTSLKNKLEAFLCFYSHTIQKSKGRTQQCKQSMKIALFPSCLSCVTGGSYRRTQLSKWGRETKQAVCILHISVGGRVVRDEGPPTRCHSCHPSCTPFTTLPCGMLLVKPCLFGMAEKWSIYIANSIFFFLVNLFCKCAYRKGLFFMYNFMRFGTCLGWCNHHHNQDMKQLFPLIGALCSKTLSTM